MKKNIAVYVLIVLLLVATSVIVVNCVLPKTDSKIFTREKWESVDETQRYLIIDDLLDNYKFIGKTRDEIISKLGRKGLRIDERKRLTYVIGQNIIDPVVFDIWFNNKGRVEDWAISGMPPGGEEYNRSYSNEWNSSTFVESK